jgi:ATP-dependent helicase Lhr and Lhr-like helicase
LDAAAWFTKTYGDPTPIQRLGWPIVERGDNVLLSAPTGTGKTLAAFLPLLTRLPDPLPESLIGLIITPLKALGQDQLGNVRRIVEALAPAARIALRTGDTPPANRRRATRTPPHLLWTTPESLAVMLTQESFRRQLATLRWVIVDEVHALAADKRGSDMALSLERVEAISGPVQRIGLSATCEPITEVARFLAGADRPCRIVAVPDLSTFELAIEPLPPTRGYIRRVVEHVLPIVARHRTTLCFANTRNVCERLGFALKQVLADKVATHHGSLSRDRRRQIETNLKHGRLSAVVCTATLELGIDIGSVDAVVFVNLPAGVARLMQRLGRSGHSPGEPRRGIVVTSHPQEILEAAVTGRAGRFGALDPIAIPDKPLDVLCQHLVGCGYGLGDRDAVLAMIRRAYPYRDLVADELDDCLRYLAGRKRDGSDWLPPRLAIQGNGFSIASRSVGQLLRRNLGTIVAEEPRPVRLEGADRIIGELDESFAERLNAGDRFLLDGRCLRLQKHGDRDLLVEESAGFPWVPRWGTKGPRVGETLARHLFEMRRTAATVLRDGPEAWMAFCRSELRLGPAASGELGDYLDAQESASEIPEPGVTLVEAVDRGHGVEYALHTPLHSAGNEAIAAVLQQRLVNGFGGKVTAAAFTLGVLLFHEIDVPLGEEAWRRLLDPAGFDRELAGHSDAGPHVRTAFASVAHVGLMVLRQPLGGRRRVGGRDWVRRRLFDQLHALDPDFVLLREARRDAKRICDGDAARRFLEAATHGPMRVRCLPEPGPIAAAWLEAGDESVHLHLQETS